MRCVAPTEKDTASTTPTLQKSTSILILLGLSIGLAFFLVSTRKHIVTEQQVLMAMQSTNQVGVVTAEGTNSLLRVGSRAIPVLLQWSKGRDPVWFKWVDPVRKIFKKPPLRGTFWSRKETARRAFAILREQATPATPELVRRLSDSDPNVRRISAQMLGAIGPSTGTQAFHRMTNCLTDPHPDVRNDVVWAIQFHRPEEYPLKTLLSVYVCGLQDSYPVARQNAMIGLTRLGEKAAPSRKAIEKALNDSDSGVRSMAQQLLNLFEKK